MQHISSATMGQLGITDGTHMRQEQHAANAMASGALIICVEIPSVTKSSVIPGGTQPGTDLPAMNTASPWLF